CGMVTATDWIGPSSVVVQAVSSAPSAAPASKRLSIANSPSERRSGATVSCATALRTSGRASIVQADQRHRLVERAGVSEVACVEHEVLDFPWARAKIAEGRQPAAVRPGRAIEPGERDVRGESPGLTPQPHRFA